MEPTTLRRLIRKKLDEGRLPLDASDKVWAGPSTGRRCAGCGEEIARGEIEMEVEEHSARLLYFFHRQCQALWDEERKGR